MAAACEGFIEHTNCTSPNFFEEELQNSDFHCKSCHDRHVEALHDRNVGPPLLCMLLAAPTNASLDLL
jgi:hypothetical protein